MDVMKRGNPRNSLCCGRSRPGDEQQLVQPVQATIFAGLQGLHIRHGGAELKTDRQFALLSQRRMEGMTRETATAMAGMSGRSAKK